LEINGIENNIKRVKTGPSNIATDSILCGISANNTKKGTMYQSGVEEIVNCEGAGFPESAGGPKITARQMIQITMIELNITSLHAALGQKGTPFS